MAPALLVGCGGGGGGGGAPAPEPTPTTYPGLQAYANFVNGALTCNYTLSGTVLGIAITGSGTRTFSAPTSTVFESQVVLAKTMVNTGVIMVMGVRQLISEQHAFYWSSNYQLLGGGTVPPDDTWIVATSSAVTPASVKVGDSGPLASLVAYADDSKTPPALATINVTYVIEAEPASTAGALFNLRTEHYTKSGVYIETDNWRLRMATDGSVGLHSIVDTMGSDTFTATCH